MKKELPPNTLEDLVEPEGYYRLARGLPQTKFHECEGCPFYNKPRTKEQDILTSGVDILIVADKPSNGDRFRPGDIPRQSSDPSKIGSEFSARTWWGLKNFIKKNTVRENGSRVYYGLTTAVMCHSDDHTTKDSPIKVIHQCGNILRRKIRLSGAKVVVLMGRQSCKASPVPDLQKITSLDTVRGKIFKLVEMGREIYYIPTHSARDVNRMPDLWSTVLHDLKKASMMLEDGFVKPPIDELTQKYVYPKTYKELEDILLPLIDQPKKIVSFDIEGTGLNSRAPDAAITVLSVAWAPGESTAIYVHKAPAKWIDLCKRFLTSSTKKVAHNAQFDIEYIMELWGITPSDLYADTMLVQYCLDENRSGGEERTLKGEFTLKKLVWDYLPEYGGYEEAGDIAHHFKNNEWEKIPKDILLKYAAVDADVTLQLFFKQLRILYGLNLKAPKEKLIQAMKSAGTRDKLLHKVMTVFMSRATYAVASLKNTGMWVDKKYLDTLCTEIPEKLKQVQEHVRATLGKPELTLTKNADISWVVYEHLGMPVEIKTPTGNPSTAEAVLDKMSKSDPSGLIEDILTYKKLSKLDKSFLKNIEGLRDPKTGRVHPGYQLIGAVTGRLSCRQPNLQQLPSYIKLPDGSRIDTKRIFAAPPGRILLYADYSQVEMRVVAAFADKYKDSSMKEAIINDLDLHCFVASKVFKIPYEEMFQKSKIEGVREYVEMRSRAKTVGFAILYGSTAYGVSTKNNIPLKEAQDLIDMFYNSFPGVEKFVKNSHLEAQNYGYVMTPFGRRRRFPVSEVRKNIDNSTKRKAQNSPVQGTASDICLRAVIGLTEEIGSLDGDVVVTVHDSLVVEIPDNPKVIREAQELMTRIMVEEPEKEYQFLRGVPLKADQEIGYNWSEMMKIEEWEKQNASSKVI